MGYGSIQAIGPPAAIELVTITSSLKTIHIAFSTLDASNQRGQIQEILPGIGFTATQRFFEPLFPRRTRIHRTIRISGHSTDRFMRRFVCRTSTRDCFSIRVEPLLGLMLLQVGTFHGLFPTLRLTWRITTMHALRNLCPAYLAQSALSGTLLTEPLPFQRLH